MSLTKDDLAAIRGIVVEGAMEAINAVVIPRLDDHDRRFDEIDQHFSEIEQHLADHDHRFDEVDSRFDKIERHLTDHDHRFDEVDSRLGSIGARLTELEGRVEALGNDVRELYAMVPPSDSVRGQGAKLTPEQRLRRLYADMQLLARELKVEL